MPRKKKPPPKTHERSWGQGSVVKVGPDAYRAYRARAHRPDGTSHRPSRTFHGPAAEALAARWAAGVPDPPVMLLGQWLERWLALRVPTVRESSAATYRQNVAICAPLAGRPLASITAEEWQRFVNGLLGRYKRSTVMTWKATISSALLAAVPEHLPANPLASVRLPKPVERPPKAWTREQARRLLAAASGLVHETWLWIMLCTGIRLGESRALLWTDFDMVALTVTIGKQLGHETDEVGPTKNGKTRVVPIPEELAPILVRHRARQAPGEQWVIRSRATGRIPSPGALDMWIQRMARKAGVPEHSPHATRHTYATLALDDGVPLKAVSEALGHANVAITAAVYSHAVERNSRRVAQSIGPLLTTPGTDPGAAGNIGAEIGSEARG